MNSIGAFVPTWARLDEWGARGGGWNAAQKVCVIARLRGVLQRKVSRKPKRFMMTKPFSGIGRRVAVGGLMLLCSSGAAFAAEERVSLDISGGKVEQGNGQSVATVAWLAQFLRGHGWNVVMGKDLGEVPIPELKLRNATVQLVAEALTITTEGRVRASVRSGDTLFLMGGGAKSGPQLEAFNLSGYLREVKEPNRSLDQLERIVIESLVSMGGDRVATPAFRFYPEAKILVAIGTAPALEVTRKIIEALPGQQPRPALPKELLLLDENP